jgi:hypothetical protein
MAVPDNRVDKFIPFSFIRFFHIPGFGRVSAIRDDGESCFWVSFVVDEFFDNFFLMLEDLWRIWSARTHDENHAFVLFFR